SPDVFDEASELAASLAVPLGAINSAVVTQDAVDRVWSEMHRHFLPNVEELGRPPALVHRMDWAPWVLSSRHLTRQFSALPFDEPPDDSQVEEGQSGAIR